MRPRNWRAAQRNATTYTAAMPRSNISLPQCHSGAINKSTVHAPSWSSYPAATHRPDIETIGVAPPSVEHRAVVVLGVILLQLVEADIGLERLGQPRGT